MQIRKYEYELCVDDLLEYPVWEFAYGEESEFIKIKPTTSLPPYDISQKRLLVRATFLLANGIKKIGFIKPINTTNTFMGHLSPIDLSPIVVTEKGQIVFWYGSHKPHRKLINKNYLWLGFQHIEIFPIKIFSDVDVINGVDKGTIESFMYCIDDEVEDYFNLKASEIRYIK